MQESELGKPAKIATKKGEEDGEGTSKLYGDWQTEPWVPKAAVDGKVRRFGGPVVLYSSVSLCPLLGLDVRWLLLVSCCCAACVRVRDASSAVYDRQ